MKITVHFAICFCKFSPSVRCQQQWFFEGVSLGKTHQISSLVDLLVKSRKDMNDVRCHCDMTKIILNLLPSPK